MPYFKPNDNDSADFAAHYGREVLFEVMYIGNSAKVTAIDAETGVEVSIIGPPNATKYSLKINAMRKLMAALAKLEHEGAEPDRRRARRPGLYV